MATVPNKASGGSFSHEDANQPFWVKSANYDSGTDKLNFVMGPGRVDWGDGTTYELTADRTIGFTPTVNTTYWFHLKPGGMWNVSTSAKSHDTGVLIASFAIGSVKSDITITDRRGMLPSLHNALLKSGGTLTGNLVMSGNVLSQVELFDVKESYISQSVASGATATIDTRYSVHLLSLSGNATIAFSNIPASGDARSVTITINNAGAARVVTWPASVKWQGGTKPTSSAGVDVYAMYTYDGGANWYAIQSGKAFS